LKSNQNLPKNTVQQNAYQKFNAKWIGWIASFPIMMIVIVCLIINRKTMKACLVRNRQSTLVNNSVHPFVIGVLHGRHFVRSNVDLEHWCVFFFSVTADVNGDSLMKLDGQWLNLEATHELNFPGE